MYYLFFLLGILFCPQTYAFDYFGNRIDYWGSEKPSTEANSPQSKPKGNSKFDWDTYSNPENPEFFKEGNHVPPEPFMELARNPTDENIKNWMEMIETKNKLMKRLHSHMADYIKRNGDKLKPEEKSVLIGKTNEIPQVPADVNRFRFRLYFDSSCPHCERMMVTIKDLQGMGYYVEARQIDRRKPTYPIPVASTLASEQEVKARKIQSWPVLFVGDTAKQLVYRIQGYQDTQTILGVLASK